MGRSISRAQALSAGLSLAGALAAPRRAQSADLVPLHIATTNSESSANCYYAVDQGFFKAQGLDVNVERFSSSGAFANAIVSGAVDIGALGAGSIVTGHAKGLPFVLVANGGIYNAESPQTMLVVLKDSPLKTAADFKGKTIAISTLQDIVHVAVMAWLETNGVDPKAVNYVEIPTPVMPLAVTSKRVDAAFLGEPYLTPSFKACRAVAAPATSIARHFLVAGWTCSRSYFAANSATVKKFQAAIAQASLWAMKNRAAATDVLIRRVNFPPELAPQMHHVNWDSNNMTQYVSPVIDAMAKYGIIAKSFLPTELFS